MSLDDARDELIQAEHSLRNMTEYLAEKQSPVWFCQLSMSRARARISLCRQRVRCLEAGA